MPEAALAPGARIECRSAEWLVRSLGNSSDGRMVVDVVGISPFLREKEARFLVEVEKAADSFKVLQPEDTELVQDPSPHYRDSLLVIEAHLRRTVPTDNSLVVGPRAAMDPLPYQLVPAAPTGQPRLGGSRVASSKSSHRSACFRRVSSMAKPFTSLSPAFHQVVPQHHGGPAAKLDAPGGMHPVAPRQNRVQIVDFDAIKLAVRGSCQGILDN